MFPSSPKLLFYLYNFWGYLRLIAQGRRHLFYFLLLTAVLVGGYALFIINDLVVGITASSIKERFL